MRSIKVRFAIAFALTGILGAVIVAFIVRGSTYKAFIDFNINKIEAEITSILTQYYQQKGSWEGVENIFDPNQPEKYQSPDPLIPFLIEDNNGKPLFTIPPDRMERINNTDTPEKIIDEGRQIAVGDEIIGSVHFFNRP